MMETVTSYRNKSKILSLHVSVGVGGRYSVRIQISDCREDSNGVILRLMNKGKYHCIGDLLFDWLGMDQTRKSVVNST